MNETHSCIRSCIYVNCNDEEINSFAEPCTINATQVVKTVQPFNTTQLPCYREVTEHIDEIPIAASVFTIIIVIIIVICCLLFAKIRKHSLNRGVA